MDFFIQNAWAEGAAPAQPGFADFIPLVILFVVFYFLLIRPQMKRAKEHKTMVAALAKGDEVVTNGGLLGKITTLGDNFVEIQIADSTVVKIQRQAIATVMPKGTMDAAV